MAGRHAPLQGSSGTLVVSWARGEGETGVWQNDGLLLHPLQVALRSPDSRCTQGRTLFCPHLWRLPQDQPLRRGVPQETFPNVRKELEKTKNFPISADLDLANIWGPHGNLNQKSR